MTRPSYFFLQISNILGRDQAGDLWKDKPKEQVWDQDLSRIKIGVRLRVSVPLVSKLRRDCESRQSVGSRINKIAKQSVCATYIRGKLPNTLQVYKYPAIAQLCSRNSFIKKLQKSPQILQHFKFFWIQRWFHIWNHKYSKWCKGARNFMINFLWVRSSCKLLEPFDNPF